MTESTGGLNNWQLTLQSMLQIVFGNCQYRVDITEVRKLLAEINENYNHPVLIHLKDISADTKYELICVWTCR